VRYGGSNTRAYSREFFETQFQESLQSAEEVVPLLLRLLPSRSVLDVGCGVGVWAATFVANGVAQVVGVDGDYLDRRRLLIPSDGFYSHDLTQPLDLERRFDLVVCLEVAEHLPANSASMLVESLVRHGDLIVFSAAVPGQGGTNHLNEQWPSYWLDHFARAGYELFDVLRPRFWYNQRVGFWYRQNLLVYATGAAADRVRALPPVDPLLDVVHPEQFALRNTMLAEVPPIRTSFNNLHTGLRRRLLR
jgi:SAM-dependent methyltransferase